MMVSGDMDAYMTAIESIRKDEPTTLDSMLKLILHTNNCSRLLLGDNRINSEWCSPLRYIGRNEEFRNIRNSMIREGSWDEKYCYAFSCASDGLLNEKDIDDLKGNGRLAA